MTSATPPQVDVSIIVVTHNAAEHVLECLRSVTGADAPRVSHEVITVDSGSSPSLVPLLRDHVPADRVLEAPGNVGFARACHLGAERARGRHLLLLNPDAVVAPGAVDALVRAADADPRCGVLGGRTLHPDGRVDAKSCWGAPSVWSQLCFATGLSALFRGNRLLDPESLGRWPRDTARDVPIVTGCLMLVPRAAWTSLGGFDRDYFMYGEDADLCLRVRRSGRRVWITPDAVATHANGASSASSGHKTVLLLKGKTTYLRKNLGPFRRVAAKTLLLVGVALRAHVARALGRSEIGWCAAWQRRREWVAGYGPYVATSPASH